MTDLYDQRIDAMHERERNDYTEWHRSCDRVITRWTEDARNAKRLAAYKRKRISVVTIDDCAIFIDGVLRMYGDDVIPEKRH